jgi:transcriptional regulator with XRE-family HTH domain
MRGLKQEQLAQALGVSRPTVANWERGTKHPGLPLLLRLADVLGVSLDELLGRRSSAPAGAQGLAREVELLASDPMVLRLAGRTGVPARAIAAFVVAMKSRGVAEEVREET